MEHLGLTKPIPSPQPSAQEKYLMHMPEGFLILHQLKVAHEAINLELSVPWWVLKGGTLKTWTHRHGEGKKMRSKQVFTSQILSFRYSKLYQQIPQTILIGFILVLPPLFFSMSILIATQRLIHGPDLWAQTEPGGRGRDGGLHGMERCQPLHLVARNGYGHPLVI